MSTNKLLMHYGCSTATGKLMQTSYSLFFVELGLSFQPLQDSYKRYGNLVTHSWMKRLWEKLSAFSVKVLIADTDQQLPRENNQYIMKALISRGYSGETLKQLNRVRVSQQVLFTSDILTALENKIDFEAWTRRNSAEQGSSLRWPHERPRQSDFQTWRTALQTICPSRSKVMTVGKFIGTPHQIWHWAWDDDVGTLHRVHRDRKLEDVFVSGRKPNRFHYSHTQRPVDTTQYAWWNQRWTGSTSV
jgi:hypothetical protein